MKDGMKMKKTWGKRNVKRKFNKAKLAALTLTVAMTAAEISALFGGMTSPVFATELSGLPAVGAVAGGTTTTPAAEATTTTTPGTSATTTTAPAAPATTPATGNDSNKSTTDDGKKDTTDTKDPNKKDDSKKDDKTTTDDATDDTKDTTPISTSDFIMVGGDWVTPTAVYGQTVNVVLPVVNM